MSGQTRVYSTEIKINNAPRALRPGMSARAEILVDKLENVLVVPVQCIANRGGQKICYVKASDESKPVRVQTGKSNDNFVQIVSGLEEGQFVMLNPPNVITASSSGRIGEQPREQQEQQEQSPNQRPGNQSGQRSGGRPNQRPDSQSGQGPGGQAPAGRPDNQQGQRPNNQPGERPNERPNRGQEERPNAG